jgi:hypothetical protein
MPKTLVVTAIIALLFIACSDNTSVTQPTPLNEEPRASDGISPTDYISMHNLSLPDPEHLPENFDPQDTIFAADYKVYSEEEEADVRMYTFEPPGPPDSTNRIFLCGYNYSELCGDYLIIYGPQLGFGFSGPQGLGFLRTYRACPEMLPDGVTLGVRDSTSYLDLNTYLDSILQNRPISTNP